MAAANNEFFEALSMLEHERGITAEYLIDKIKAAIVIAVKKNYEVEDDNVMVEIDPATGSFNVALVQDIVADEDVVHKKPHAEPVLVLLERQGAEPGDALVVGDTDYDILMGKAAGVKTCGVTYGNHSRERLSAAGADFIIDDFRELLTLQ